MYCEDMMEAMHIVNALLIKCVLWAWIYFTFGILLVGVSIIGVKMYMWVKCWWSYKKEMK